MRWFNEEPELVDGVSYFCLIRGARLESAMEEAREMARRFNEGFRFRYGEGVFVTVHPDSDPDLLVRAAMEAIFPGRAKEVGPYPDPEELARLESERELWRLHI